MSLVPLVVHMSKWPKTKRKKEKKNKTEPPKITRMAKTLSMVSHINYNLSANEGFVIILTSKLITCFIDGFTLKMKYQSIVYLLNGSEHIYSGFWTLKMKCTRYGLYGQVAFKNARVILFLEIGQGAWSSSR